MLKERLEEIHNLDPRIFALYLEGIDKDDIEYYETMKKTCGLQGHNAELLLRNNMISNCIANNLSKQNTFHLKLAELAMDYPNDNYFSQLAYGNPERGEMPFSNKEIAERTGTREANVEMQLMLNAKLQEIYSKQKNNKLVK